MSRSALRAGGGEIDRPSLDQPIQPVLGARRIRALQQQLGRAQTLEDLFARASAEAARVCQFDRAVVLAVEHGALVATATGAIDNADCDALRRAVLSHPVLLLADSVEAELVRVPDRRTDSRKSGPSVLAASLDLVHHLVVPIAPESRTIALLVLDRPTREVEEPDRENAEIVVQLLESSLECMVLRERLRQLEESIRALTATSQALVREAIHAPVELPREGGGGFTLGLVGSEERPDPTTEAQTGTLTPRERQVAALLVAGRSNREIAATLHISPETVKGNVAKLLRKLRASNRVEAVAHLARSPHLVADVHDR